MGLSKLWGKDSSGNRGFVFSHIKTIYYNWAQKKLLSTKLDEMDSATNGKIDKTSIVQVESTSQTNVPSSAYLKTVKDSLDGDISELNAKTLLCVNNGLRLHISSDEYYSIELLNGVNPGNRKGIYFYHTHRENGNSEWQYDLLESWT